MREARAVRPERWIPLALDDGGVRGGVKFIQRANLQWLWHLQRKSPIYCHRTFRGRLLQEYDYAIKAS